jgi:hypothetical protein
VNPNGITDNVSKKRMYHAKTLSDNAIYNTFIRLLDVQPKFNEDVNIILPVIDFTEYGLGLLYAILPIEFQPITVDFKYEPPTTDDVMQGIWAKFKPVDFSTEYAWMTDFMKYVTENFKDEYQQILISGAPQKARYGRTPWGYGIYDPIVMREFLRATFMRLRLLRTADISWMQNVKDIAEYLKMTGVTDAHIYNRMMMVLSAQKYAFVLGLSLLGRSRFCKVENGWGYIPIVRHDGKAGEVKFRTLDQLLFGFILGVTPLGYGLLMPKEGVLKSPDGKKNPRLFETIKNKIKGVRDRYTLTTFSYSNYNRPEEMADYHKSERTNQYHYLQTIRRMIEEWVDAQIRDIVSEPFKVRQYKNAVLQAIFWRAKRHCWGFQGFQALTEEQWRELWRNLWVRNGLDPAILDKLYANMTPFIEAVRKERIEEGEKIKRTRTTMASIGG